MSKAVSRIRRTSRGRANPLFVKSLEKAFAVLNAFATDQFLSLAQLAAATGLDKSTVQRVTYTLRQLGYVEQDPATRRYAPGRRLLDLSFNYLRHNPLIERASLHLIDLHRAVRERVDLSLLDGETILYAVRVQSKRYSFSTTLVGRRMPIFCTSGGRAMLARLSEAEAREIVERCHRRKLTAHTITNPDAIMAKVAEARRDLHALQVEECLPGEVAVGSAVADGAGRPVAAVHIAASLSEWTPESFRKRMAPLVIEAARSLSR